MRRPAGEAGRGQADVPGHGRDLTGPPRRDQSFARIEGRARGTAVASQALGSIAGGALGALSLRLPVLASLVTLVLAAITARGFPSPSRPRSERAPWRVRAQLRHAWALLRRLGELRRASSIFALLGALQWAGFWLLQPQLVERGMTAMEIGAIAAAVLTMVFAASRFVDRVIERALTHVPRLAALGTACALASLAIGRGSWTLVMFAAISWFEVLMSTAITMRSLAAAPARLAATVLSLMMAARRIVYALLMLGVGELTVRYGVASAAGALAGLSALTLVLLAGGSRQASSAPRSAPDAAPLPPRG